MTVKEAYISVLTEIRKSKSPSLHLEDYNYWMNKGIQEYINVRYIQFAKTQQLSDDLQALTTSVNIVLTTTFAGVTGVYTGGFSDPSVVVSTGKKYGSNFYRFKSPDNYWHFTGAHVTGYTKFMYKCYPKGHEANFPSKRLTSNIANGIINNAFLKPNFNRPYHSFTDGTGLNVKPDLLFYVGDITKFGINDVSIDYLKEPMKINLTASQRDLPLDTSDTMEFQEYVCNEIVKKVVALILEVSSDPRLQTQIPINTSIA